MNIGIIGYGNIAKRFFESVQYTDEGKVTAIASKSLFKNKAFQAMHPEIRIYESYEALLFDSTIDGIYIALPHKDHKKWALKALAQKLPVLCEKPAVLTTSEMDEIIAASKENKTLFLEAFKTPFNDGFVAFKEDIQQLGSIQKIEASFCFEGIEGRSSTSYLLEKDQGGALNDIGTYVIGFVLALIDSPVAQVTASKDFVSDVDSYFSAKLFFENTVEALVEGAIDREKERVARIVGKNGSITIPFFYRMTDYTIDLNNQATIQKDFPLVGDDMTLEIQHFINHVKAGDASCKTNSLTATRKIIEVMELIRKA